MQYNLYSNTKDEGSTTNVDSLYDLNDLSVFYGPNISS